MLRLPININKTLSVKLSLQVVCTIAILLMASLVVMLHFSRKALKEEALNNAEQTLEGTVQHIDNILLSVEQTAGNFYFNIATELQKPEKMIFYCRKLVESNPYVIGCAVAMKPHFYKDRELFMAYVHHAKYGAKADSDTLIEASTFSNRPYTEQEWYTLPIKQGAPCWTNPLKGADAEGEALTTFCLPFYDEKGERIGVLAVDVALNLLSEVVLSAKPSPNSYSTLLGSDGSYIVHPDSNKRLHRTVYSLLEDNENHSAWEAAEAMLAGESGYRYFKKDGKDCYVFYKPFKRLAVPGRAMKDLHWSVGIIYPEDDIFGDYNRLLYLVMAIAIIGLLLLFVLCQTITHRQLLPLGLLTKSAQRIAEGNYEESIPDSHQYDEIGQLHSHFQQMQQSLAAHIKELEQLKDTLQEQGNGLRLAYQQTQEADRMKTDFLHNMTNQMIEPTKVICQDVEDLLNASHQPEGEDVCRLVDDIQKQGKTVTELLNNLLNKTAEGIGKEEVHE